MRLPAYSKLNIKMSSRSASTKSTPAPIPALTPGASNMYKFEASLPHLPVPTLKQTAARYLKSTLPFQTPTTAAAVDSFLTSPLVNTLQERLQARAAGKLQPSFLSDLITDSLSSRVEFFFSVSNTESRLHFFCTLSEHPNWLSDWWNESAYFGWRGPNIPWVNYFYVHRDDKARTTGPKRAASLVRGLMYFRQMSDT
jgi:carnitine O-acetyltransferase